MSKIIKACYVEKQCTDDVVKDGDGEGKLTTEVANDIYIETKIMIEELVSEAQKNAEKIVCGAEEKASKLLEESKREIEEIKGKSYIEGMNSGYKDGTRKAEEELSSLVQTTNVMLAELVKVKEDYLKNNDEDILELVLLISEKIVRTVVETKPEVICEVVKNVLKRLKGSECITLKVNPIHVPYLDDYGEQGSEFDKNKITIEEDSGLKPGECVIMTKNGYIEAIIDEQLTILKKALKEEINNAEF
ncbi:MAG: FliH/SctL family protein [Clostridia bacterium]|nr:FliH/SctL family protein [Clostridia bacterium]MDD4048299.1 FliH/SctL family protein [Clostridia bacterium]